MKIAALVIISMIPIEVFADQYYCKNNKRPGQATVEASSMAEADYKFKEIYGQYSTPRCTNQTITGSSDIFVRDITFANNQQLRSYVPSDLKPSGKAGYRCDSSGSFLADNDRNYGGCSVFISTSSATEWKIRYISGGAATKVWTKKGGAWGLWVEFEPPPNLYSVIVASPEARQYAASHGTSPRTASQQRGSQTGTSIPPAPAPTPNPNLIEDAVKKGVGDLLKGFGR